MQARVCRHAACGGNNAKRIIIAVGNQHSKHCCEDTGALSCCYRLAIVWGGNAIVSALRAEK